MDVDFDANCGKRIEKSKFCHPTYRFSIDIETRDMEFAEGVNVAS